jgi:hypothetical protein
MQNVTIAATRSTKNGMKVYIHSNCECSRINGKAIPAHEVSTVEQAEQWAVAFSYPFTLCKTSQVTETPADDAAELDQDEEEGFEGGGAPEFEVTVDNTDQFGKQRRDAVAALVQALGAELAFKGIKNKHRTGNDAFQVIVTKAPAHLEPLVNSFLERMDEEVPEVVDGAKAEGLANAWDANTRQKHYKNSARAYITAQGAELAAKLA